MLSEYKRKNDIPEYKVWKAMRARCSHGCKSNMLYKENGITVSEEWNDFNTFYSDMGKKPSTKHSIDRINNKEGYSKENCRWATQAVQCQNRSEFNILIEYNGETKVLKQWAIDLNIDYSSLHKHIKYYGKTFEEAILIMMDDGKLEYNGQRKSRKELSEEFGISVAMLNDRLSRKWTLERALTQKPKLKTI